MAASRGALGPLLAAIGLSTACSSSSTPNTYCDPDGLYELTVVSTGQSGVISESCGVGQTRVIDLALRGATVTMYGETCALCSSNSCQLNIVCGRSVSCPGAVVPVSDAPPTYIQSASFVRPNQPNQPTGNAVVTLGADFCVYTGTAVQKK